MRIWSQKVPYPRRNSISQHSSFIRIPNKCTKDSTCTIVVAGSEKKHEASEAVNASVDNNSIPDIVPKMFFIYKMYNTKNRNKTIIIIIWSGHGIHHCEQEKEVREQSISVEL